MIIWHGPSIYLNSPESSRKPFKLFYRQSIISEVFDGLFLNVFLILKYYHESINLVGIAIFLLAILGWKCKCVLGRISSNWLGIDRLDLIQLKWCLMGLSWIDWGSEAIIVLLEFFQGAWNWGFFMLNFKVFIITIYLSSNKKSFQIISGSIVRYYLSGNIVYYSILPLTPSFKHDSTSLSNYSYTEAYIEARSVSLHFLI